MTENRRVAWRSRGISRMTEPSASAPPQFSPDGRWWWDGTQWIPVPPPPPPVDQAEAAGPQTGVPPLVGTVTAAAQTALDDPASRDASTLASLSVLPASEPSFGRAASRARQSSTQRHRFVVPGLLLVVLSAVGVLVLRGGPDALPGGGGDVRITGHVDVDNLLASKLADLDCTRMTMKADIKDGSGKILKVVEGDTTAVERPGSNGHVFATCEGTYDVKVPASDVYTIESEYFPLSSGKRVSKTFNRTDLEDGQAPTLVLFFDPLS